jgi:hypothetical protein
MPPKAHSPQPIAYPIVEKTKFVPQLLSKLAPIPQRITYYLLPKTQKLITDNLELLTK